MKDDLQSITSSILQKFQSIPEKTSALIHELAETQLSLQQVKKERDECFKLLNNLTNNMNCNNNSSNMNGNNCNLLDSNKKTNIDYKNKNVSSLTCSTELNELRKLLHSMEKENEVLHNALEKSYNVRLQQRVFMETLLNTSSGSNKNNNTNSIIKASIDNVDKSTSNGCDTCNNQNVQKCCNTSITSTNNTCNQTEDSQQISAEENQEKVQINYKTFTRKNNKNASNNNTNNVTIFLKPHERYRPQKHQRKTDDLEMTKTMTRPKSKKHCTKNKEYWDQTFSEIHQCQQLQRRNQRIQQQHAKERK